MQKKILIVDDDPDIRMLFEFLLKNEGYATKTASNGNVCLEILAKETYPVMLLDMMMPEMSGIEVLGRVKKDFPDVEVIIVTAFSSINSAIEMLEKGAFAYISKPINKSELLSNVRKAYEKYELVTENRSLKDQKQKADRRLVQPRLMSVIDFSLGLDPGGRIESVSEELCRLLGYAKDELLGSSFGIVFQRDYMEKRLAGLMMLSETPGYDMVLMTKTDEAVPGSFTGKLIVSAQGLPLGFSGHFKRA